MDTSDAMMQNMDEKKPAIDTEKTQQGAIREAALPILISRAGGSITFTKKEFDQVAAMYGGPHEMVMQVQELAGGGITSRTFRITLARRKPQSGELPV